MTAIVLTGVFSLSVIICVCVMFVVILGIACMMYYRSQKKNKGQTDNNGTGGGGGGREGNKGTSGTGNDGTVGSNPGNNGNGGGAAASIDLSGIINTEIKVGEWVNNIENTNNLKSSNHDKTDILRYIKNTPFDPKEIPLTIIDNKHQFTECMNKFPKGAMQAATKDVAVIVGSAPSRQTDKDELSRIARAAQLIFEQLRTLFPSPSGVVSSSVRYPIFVTKTGLTCPDFITNMDDVAGLSSTHMMAINLPKSGELNPALLLHEMGHSFTNQYLGWGKPFPRIHESITEYLCMVLAPAEYIELRARDFAEWMFTQGKSIDTEYYEEKDGKVTEYRLKFTSGPHIDFWSPKSMLSWHVSTRSAFFWWCYGQRYGFETFKNLLLSYDLQSTNSLWDTAAKHAKVSTKILVMTWIQDTLLMSYCRKDNDTFQSCKRGFSKVGNFVDNNMRWSAHIPIDAYTSGSGYVIANSSKTALEKHGFQVHNLSMIASKYGNIQAGSEIILQVISLPPRGGGEDSKQWIMLIMECNKNADKYRVLAIDGNATSLKLSQDASVSYLLAVSHFYDTPLDTYGLVVRKKD